MGKQWDKIFKQKGKVFTKPQEDIPKIVKLFKKNGIKRVLDLGCGSGRHTVYLAKNGFEVYGFDNSFGGIKITKDWLKNEKLKASFKIGDIYKRLPYKNKFFDAIISIQVINHASIKNIRKLIKETERILKPGGLIFITVRRRIFRKWQIGSVKPEFRDSCKIIGPRTYVPTEGGEKGLVHYLFNKKIMRKEFKSFKIHNIWASHNKRHYSLLGELKLK